MKLSAIIIAFFIVTSGNTQDFSFNDQPYALIKMGKKYIIYQRSYVVSARDLSTLAKIDCTKLESNIAHKKGLYNVCLDDPDSPYCHLLKQDILFMSKEENFQSPPSSFRTPRKWSMKRLVPKENKAALIQFAAGHFQVPEKDILLKETQRNSSAAALIVELKDESLLKTVTLIVPLGSGFLENPILAGSDIVANNRFFACDLEHRRMTVGSNFSASIFHEETYAPELIDKAWNIYEKTASLIQSDDYKSSANYMKAALIGAEISLGLVKENIKNHDTINLKSILTHWFSEFSGSLELKMFSSKAHFKEAFYSDQFYENSVKISWRIQ
ncbi:MAG: hypothetical protein KC505_10750 [Myxococcales bacterium]|nr:hypothetical protein [Myxococcales bacterium]